MAKTTMHLLWIGLLFLPRCSAPKKPDDVILIVIDTWRCDYAELMRQMDVSATPFLDKLTEDGLSFSQCRSHSSNTNLSMSVLWSGHLPDETGVLTQMSPLPQRFETVAEVFRAHGYETAGFSANPVLTPKKGFSQGFDHYVVTDLEGESLLDALFDFMERRKHSEKPLFLYAHFMDCHFPYFAGDCIEAFDVAPLELFDRVHRHQADVEGVLFGQALSDEDISRGRARYLASICHIDRLLEHMADGLGDMWPDARVIVTADHGESLGEHGYYFGHSLLTYEVSLRVPLIIKLPSGMARATENQVSHLDVHDELIRWAEAGHGTLTEREDDRRRQSRIHLAWGHPNLGQFPHNAFVPVQGRFGARRSAMWEGQKVIVIPQPDGSMTVEAFDLKDDPYETRNLGPDGVAHLDHGEELLAALDRDALVESEELPLDDSERDTLRSLGYLGN